MDSIIYLILGILLGLGAIGLTLWEIKEGEEIITWRTYKIGRYNAPDWFWVGVIFKFILGIVIIFFSIYFYLD